MQRFARVKDSYGAPTGMVVEIFDCPAPGKIRDWFGEDIASLFVPCEIYVQLKWVYDAASETFSPPVEYPQ